MFEGFFQPMHLLVIVGLALLMFGPKKLPELGKGIGSDHMRLAEVEKTAGQISEAQAERKLGIEIFKLNLLAYPDSADAHSNLADAYLQDGQRDLARRYAETALAMLESHTAPLSSWSDTTQRRDEIRQGIQDTLKKLAEGSR